jgi:hypothetical protein
MDLALKETQTRFYALDLNSTGQTFKVDDGFNILNLKVKDADQDNALNYIASTYDPTDQVIRDGLYEGGRKIISFNGVLSHDIFPLPEIMQMAMKRGTEAMRRSIEIEFACNLSDDGSGDFYLLQIRPIVDAKQMIDVNVAEIPDEKCLMRSHNSLGHGILDDISDVVYVKTGSDFTAVDNPAIVDEIDMINRRFLSDDKNYILIGPGRWGSSDPWLGIPIKWPNINAAKLIVEVALKNYRIDPSQGTHFFQNLTSFGVGYFTVDTNVTSGGVCRKDILDAMPAVEETKHVRHVRFDSPVKIMMDGLKQEGVVIKS